MMQYDKNNMIHMIPHIQNHILPASLYVTYHTAKHYTYNAYKETQEKLSYI